MLLEKPEIMTVAEVAQFLRVSERTVYEWAATGSIPCGKLGTTWRFKRSEVEKWVNENLSGARKPVSFAPISIAQILAPDDVLVLSADNKDAALTQMLNHLARSGRIADLEAITEGIFQREKLMSTGIGLGIGIPHVRHDSISTLIMAVGLNSTDLSDYESIDNAPVRLMFMILAGRDQHAMHIKTMAAISSRVRNPVLRAMLMQADSSDTLYSLLTQ